VTVGDRRCFYAFLGAGASGAGVGGYGGFAYKRLYSVEPLVSEQRGPELDCLLLVVRVFEKQFEELEFFSGRFIFFAIIAATNVECRTMPNRLLPVFSLLRSASFCFGIISLSMRQRERAPFAHVSKHCATRRE
jgi:hypothetical protein